MIRHLITRYWDVYHERLVQISVLGLIAFWVYSSLILGAMPVEVTILVIVLFASFSIEMLWEKLKDVEYELSSLSGIESNLSSELAELKSSVETELWIWPDVQEANYLIENVIDETRPEAVYLLEYNSISGKGILDKARSNGTKIYLLQRNPHETVNGDHSQLVQRRIIDMYEEGFDPDRITIRFYNRSASVKARKIDDEFVCAGWYTFDPRKQRPRDRQIWGQENPMICASREDTPGKFATVNDWLEGVMNRLWHDGTSPEELYLSSEGPDELSDWIQSANEAERTERRKWLMKVSGDADEYEWLF